MRRYELSDAQWNLISGFFPAEDSRQGRPWRSHRQVFNGILWVLFCGGAWRDLPERFGPWKTVYGRFNRWQKDGTFVQILTRLQLKMDEEGLLDCESWMVDSTISRAHKSASGARKKKQWPNLLITLWEGLVEVFPVKYIWSAIKKGFRQGQRSVVGIETTRSISRRHSKASVFHNEEAGQRRGPG